MGGPEEEVNRRLEQVMLDSYHTVRGLVEQRNLTWRTAAYVVGLGRVAKSDRSPRGVRDMSINPADARAFPGFAQLDDRSIDDLRARLQPVRLRPGETLFRRGDQNASLYLLFRGDVDIVEIDGDRPVATRRARTVIGELGLL